MYFPIMTHSECKQKQDRQRVMCNFRLRLRNISDKGTKMNMPAVGYCCIMILSFFSTKTLASEIYDVFDICGVRKYTDGVRLMLRFNETVVNKTDCMTDIISQDLTSHFTIQIQMSASGLHLNDKHNCGVGVEINQLVGDTGNENREGRLYYKENLTCTNMFNHIVADSNQVKVKFSDIFNNVGKFININITLTPFHTAKPKVHCPNENKEMVCLAPGSNAEICIKNTLRCDGTPDCADGKDEDPNICTRLAEQGVSTQTTHKSFPATTESPADFSSIWSYTSIGVFAFLVIILLIISLTQCLRARRQNPEASNGDSNAMYRLSDAEEGAGNVNPGYAPPEYSLVRRQISQTPSDLSLPPCYDEALSMPISPMTDDDVAIVQGIPKSDSAPAIAQESIERPQFTLQGSVNETGPGLRTSESLTALT